MTLRSTHTDVLIIGAGAAGLMCGAIAGQRGRRVAILEHNSKPGRKIRISGGGRCNFTNLYVSAENYASENPHFCKSAFARYTSYDFIDLVERHGIAYHERLHGQLFCDDSAQEIIDMLCAECDDGSAELITRCEVRNVAFADGLFVLQTSQGEWTAASLVVATGGLSIPKIGATGFGYQLAEQFGLSLVERRPALVPFTWNERDKPTFTGLSGISFATGITCGQKHFQEQMLLTHRGLSGPVVLQISLHWQPGETIHIDLLPDEDVANALQALKEQREQGALMRWLRERLPKRFLRAWGEQHLPDASLRQLNEDGMQQLLQSLTGWEVMPNGTEGYRTAEATAGGVDTRELSSKTMEARAFPGLFFIGEVVDVTGWLGGYNFQWAWSSAYAAGLAV